MGIAKILTPGLCATRMSNGLYGYPRVLPFQQNLFVIVNIVIGGIKKVRVNQMPVPVIIGLTMVGGGVILGVWVLITILASRKSKTRAD
jgi:hypothetical protein